MAKTLKPPVVPENKKGIIDKKTGEVNHKLLLEQNFDPQTVTKDV